MIGIPVSVQAVPATLATWLDLADSVESLGFDALLVGDHPGDGDPFVALAAAAAATNTISLGSYVVQLGVREPHHVADAAATLDRFAPGRVILGIGAGHTPAEWAAVGRERPGPHSRVQRLVESVDLITRLLAGERVSAKRSQVEMRNAEVIRPDHAGRIRLLIGGGHPDLLTIAAQQADIVGLSGLGRTLTDGHRHTVRWSAADLTRQLTTVRAAAEQAGRTPQIEALVQVVEITDDRDHALSRLVERVPGLTVADAAATPHVLIGSQDEIVAQLQRQALQLGITRYVIRASAMHDFAPVLSRLSQDRMQIGSPGDPNCMR